MERPVVKYIPQRTESDCIIACLAMVTNQSYEQVAEDLGPYLLANPDEGVGNDAFYEYLAMKGYTTMTVPKFYSPQQKDMVAWPPPVFAPIHIAGVMYDEYHGVVVDWRGLVFDPADLSITSLQEYEDVFEVVGIWRKP